MANSAPPFLSIPTTTMPPPTLAIDKLRSNDELYSTDAISCQIEPPRSLQDDRLETGLFPPDLSRDDMVVAVMGSTGAGKSTFIKMATGTESVQIGHRLSSCTTKVQAVRCRNPNGQRDVVFVDTPGFDDTKRKDAKILEDIADWMQLTYRNGVKLSGVLYLHRITANRVTKVDLRNLDMFKGFCGDDALSHAVFVTTQWDLLGNSEDLEEGIEREGELRSNFLSPFLLKGSQMQRFESSYASAWDIVNSLPLVGKPLKIQQEIVDEGKRLEDTAAGRTLFAWLQTTSQTNNLKELVRRLERLSKRAMISEEDNKSRSGLVKHQLKNAIANLKRRLGRGNSCLFRRTSGRNTSRSPEAWPIQSGTENSSWRVVLYRTYVKFEKKIKSRFQQRRDRRRCSPMTRTNIGPASIVETSSSVPLTPCDVPDIDPFLEAATEHRNLHAQADQNHL